MKRVLILFSLSIILQLPVLSQVPSGYYSGTDGLTKQQLKNKLHLIISGHKVRTYGEFRDLIIPDLDEDPANPSNIILFYKNTSIPKTNFATNNEPDYWNREHTWPKSHGFPDLVDTAYTDVYNLRPSDATVNISKSNKDFNNVDHTSANAEGEAANTYTTTDFWEPRDEIKGDVARILLYMDVRYESKYLDLSLVDRISFSGDPELGVLTTILKWHEADPVSEDERMRHEKSYGYQLNRNPFIDHPEWVKEIWGDISGPYLTNGQAGFSEDFGSIPFGSDLIQKYVLNAYNITETISVTVESPFFLSSDQVNFSNSLTLIPTSSNQSFTVYLKFAPTISSGESYNRAINHSVGGADLYTLSVRGTEGEAGITPIALARQMPLGTKVKVTGVVLDNSSNSANSRTVYDGTAGIVVRSFDAGNESAPLVIGDSVVVQGGLSEYSNLLQVEVSPIVIEKVKSNAKLPSPQEVTISEIGEGFESELVVIRDVVFLGAGSVFAGGGSAGNFSIRDDTGTMIFRIGSDSHPLVGRVVPSGRYDIVGVIGQFASDYQISIRTIDDLTKLLEEAPSVTSIANAREMNDGERVSISGIVIGGPTNSADNRVVFDGTAGIVVRGLSAGFETSILQVGDSVVVTGVLLDYFGLREIQGDVTFEVISSGNTLPDPLIISIGDVSENYESQLVTINDVSFTSSGDFKVGSFLLTDGMNELPLRIGQAGNELVGEAIPEGLISITGYLGQNTDGYHLFVNEKASLEIQASVLGYPSKNQFVSFPNPASQFLNFSGLNIEWIEVLDLSGKSILLLSPSQNKVDVSQLESGVYIFKMIGQGFVGTTEILISR